MRAEQATELNGRAHGWQVIRKFLLPAVAVLLAAAAASATGVTHAVAGADDDDQDQGQRVYAIGLWGDLPYSDEQALVGVPNLIADMNSQQLAFTVQDGDLKAGSGIPGSKTVTTCADALYTQALGYFNSLKAPVIFTPAITIGRTVIVRQTADFPRSNGSTTSGNFSSARHSRWASIACTRMCKQRPCASA